MSNKHQKTARVASQFPNDLSQQLAVKLFQVFEKFLPALEDQAAVIFEPRSMTFHTEAGLTEVVQVLLVI